MATPAETFCGNPLEQTEVEVRVGDVVRVSVERRAGVSVKVSVKVILVLGLRVRVQVRE